MVFFWCFFSWLWRRFLHLQGGGSGGGGGGGIITSFRSRNDVTFLTFFSLFYYVDDATLLTSSLDVNTSMMIRSCLSSLDLMVVTPLPLFGGVGFGGWGWGGGIITSFRSRPMMLLSLTFFGFRLRRQWCYALDFLLFMFTRQWCYALGFLLFMFTRQWCYALDFLRFYVHTSVMLHWMSWSTGKERCWCVGRWRFATFVHWKFPEIITNPQF